MTTLIGAGIGVLVVIVLILLVVLVAWLDERWPGMGYVATALLIGAGFGAVIGGPL